MRKQLAAFTPSLLILLFAYAALSKLFSIGQFINVLWQSPLIGPGAGVVAWTVPLTELAIVLLLFFSSTRLWGLRASLVLLLLFSGYIGLLLLRGGDLPCQCGGVLGRLGWGWHLVMNLAFCGLCWNGIEQAVLMGRSNTNPGKHYTN